MALTLADVPLLLPPADLVAHLERYRPLEDLRLFGELRWNERDTRGNSRAGIRAGRGVAIPNYSPDPPLALNTFYWPSGAARFARGVFLADGARLPRILAATGATAKTAVPLTIADETNGQRITTSVYLLPIRPLADLPGATGLYLLPVVDERYWWQYCNAAALEITTASTYEDVLAALAGQLNIDLGTVIASTAAAAYGQPDPTEFSRPYENAAVLLDALAAAVGIAIARDWRTGATILYNPTDAAAAVDPAIRLAFNHPHRLAGHEEVASAAHASAIPAAVDVVFPRYCGDFAQCDGTVYTITKPAPGAAGPAHTRKTFHSTAWASFTSPTDSTPANITALDALAEQLASDYYGWQQRRYDLSFAGFYPWPANPFDDWIIWRYGASDSAGEPTRAHTRVFSRPLNSGVEEVLNQVADVPTWENPVRVRLTGTLTAGGTAPGRRQEWDGAAYSDTGAAITVRDYTGKQTAASGDKIYARHWCDRCEYEAIVPGRTVQLYLFYLDEPLTRGGNALATIRQWAAPPVSGGPWAATGASSQRVYDSSSLGPAPQAGDATKQSGVCWLNEESGRLEIVAVNRSAILWAVATAKWTNAAGNASTVACNMATDKAGTLVAGPVPITVYLPRPDGGAKKAIDPNVQSGDVIGYVLDDGGNAICITDVNDDAIGTVKWWNDVAGNIPRGWRQLSGAAGKFIVAVGPGDANYDPSTLGATGGTSDHKHSVTISGTTSNASLSGTVSGSATVTAAAGAFSASGTASVTFGTTAGSLYTDYAEDFVFIEDHDPHTHSVICSTSDLAAGGATINHLSTCPSTSGSTSISAHVIEDVHRHQIAKADIAAALTGTVSLSTIAGAISLSGTATLSSLTVTIPDHNHTFNDTSDTDTKAHIPPFYALYLIERFE